MYRFTLTVPATLNDGAPVPSDDVALIESRLIDIAGGFTAAAAEGAWRSPDGAIYREPVTVYTVDTDTDRSAALRQLAEWVALALGQEGVYVTRLPILAAEVIAAPVLP